MKGISILNFLISIRREFSYSYQNQRNDYYKALLAFRNMNGLIKKFDEFQSSNDFVITPQNMNPLGLSFNDSAHKCEATLGKARFEVEVNKDHHYQVSFYRLMMEKVKTIVQLHFINNQLIYIRIQFDELDQYQIIKNQVFNSIFYKYELSSTNAPREMVIRDPQNNMLKCRDNGKIYLEYCSGMTAHKAIIENLRNNGINQTVKSEVIMDFI